MTLIIGILVDDSIVVLENVERHFQRGEGPAAGRDQRPLGDRRRGDRHHAGRRRRVLADLVSAGLGRAVLARVRSGRHRRDADLAVRLVHRDAVAGRPLVAALDLAAVARRSSASARRFERARSTYVDRVLHVGAWRGAGWSSAISALSLVVALALIPLGLVGFEYIPPVDRGRDLPDDDVPAGTPLETTRRGLARGRERDRRDARRASRVGDGRRLPRPAQRLHQQRRDRADEHLPARQTLAIDRRTGPTASSARRKRIAPGATIVVAVPATDISGGNAQPIDEVVSSTRRSTRAVRARRWPRRWPQRRARSTSRRSAADDAPQVERRVRPRPRARARRQHRHGLDRVRAAFGGDLATQFTGADGLKDVLVTYPQAAQTSLAAIEQIPIRASDGSIVHVGDIAHARASAGTADDHAHQPPERRLRRRQRRARRHALERADAPSPQRLRALNLPASVTRRRRGRRQPARRRRHRHRDERSRCCSRSRSSTC